jgi:peptide/nickel transport system permease protein
MHPRYLLNRFGILLLVVVFAVTVNFLIPRLSPVDPIESRLLSFAAQGGVRIKDIKEMVRIYHEKFGLDQPLWKQYLNYWSDLVRLDLGYSLVTFPDRVADRIIDAMPWTIGLLMVSILISFVIGSILGALLVWQRKGFLLRLFAPVFMTLSTVPYYLLGLILIFLFSVTVRWFPSGGGYKVGTVLSFDWTSVLNILRHATLPALSIVLASIGFWALAMRSMMVTIMEEDYIKFAEAKGLRERRIFLWYALRNALLPQVTTLALSLGNVMSGAVLLEVVFAYPGIGYRLFRSISGNDYFMIQGIILVLIMSVALALFIVDVAYPLLDPRITYENK